MDTQTYGTLTRLFTRPSYVQASGSRTENSPMRQNILTKKSVADPTSHINYSAPENKLFLIGRNIYCTSLSFLQYRLRICIVAVFLAATHTEYEICGV